MNVGIIGCGAAGMIAALTAVKEGYKVTILERNSEPGKKLLVTGNGKCNYTNANISVEHYNDCGKELFKSVYSAFNRGDTLAFFENIGIMPYEKNGYVYPRSEQAISVVDCLNAELKRQNIKVIYGCVVKNIVKKDVFYVYSDNKEYVFDKLIIATGSNASPKTGSDGSGYGLAIRLGHKIKKPLPALCGLKCKGTDFKAISGVRCQAKVTLKCDGDEIKSDCGELQITDYGISGIPVFQISGEALRLLDEGRDVTVSVDFAKEYTNNELLEKLRDRTKLIKDGIFNNYLEGFLNLKLANLILKEAECAINEGSNEESINTVLKLIKSSEYKVTGHRGFDNCQVCSGGIYTDDLKDTLESKICPGLYFAGEIIDVDGICGGYNLQWAWSSGCVAGKVK